MVLEDCLYIYILFTYRVLHDVWLMRHPRMTLNLTEGEKVRHTKDKKHSCYPQSDAISHSLCVGVSVCANPEIDISKYRKHIYHCLNFLNN